MIIAIQTKKLSNHLNNLKKINNDINRMVNKRIEN